MRAAWLSIVVGLVACGGPEQTAAPARHAERASPEVEVETLAAEPAHEPAPPPRPVPVVIAAGAPGAAIVASAPPEHLAHWDLPEDPEERARLVPAGASLIAIGARRIVAYAADGSTPTRSRDNPLGASDRYVDATIASAPIAGGVLLVRGAEDLIAGLDVQSLEVRWTAHSNIDERSRQEAHLATDDAFVVISQAHMIGVDAATGARLFRRELARHEQAPDYVRWRAAGGVVVGALVRGRGVAAYDARTGQERWVAPGVDEPRIYDADGGRIPALVDHHTAVILRADDGSELARFPLGATVWHGRGLVLAGATLYAGVRARGYTDWQLRAYDVATGRERWRSPVVHARADDHPDLAIDEDVVFACTDGRVLHAFDRSDGRARWWAFPSTCGSPRVWHPVAGAPGVVLASEGSANLYARAADARTYRALVISGALTFEGRPRARVLVRVGDTWARTDAGGRYRARVRAWDDVPVDVDCEGCVPLSRTIEIDEPATTRRLDLPIESIPGYAPGLDRL